MNISVLLTCHNRCTKTEVCLQSIKKALASYNRKRNDKISLEIFLTDDDCTDSTVEVARGIFPDEEMLHILRGNGNLYWAGGMRFCWNEAIKQHQKWDYYLLLNDDVELFSNVFAELIEVERYVVDKIGIEGIVSGITCAREDHSKLTYGGDVWINRILSTRRRLQPVGNPQFCDFTNANILLVPSSVVDKIGILYEGYRHGYADFDYAYMACKHKIPVVLTANFCGACDNDHSDAKTIARKVIEMTLEQRKNYFSSPIHSSSDYMSFVRRTQPIRLPMVWLGRMLNLYFPKLYYKLCGLR